jgi:phosphoesterase RecJ-like protein
MTKISDDFTRVSLRSKGNLDVSAIAAKFGGGGHRRAAGIKSGLDFRSLKDQIISSIKDEIK